MTRQEEIKQAAVETFENDPSMVSTLGRMSFELGAKWADKTMIERAVEWLDTHVNDYVIAEETEYDGASAYVHSNIFNDFREAMEGDQ